VAPGATVQEGAQVGAGTTVWDGALVRTGAVVGDGCTIGRGVYVDSGVTIGDRCKVQDNALLYQPARIGAGAFIGPAVVLTNDRHPRAVNPDGQPLAVDGWHAEGVEVAEGAALGAGSVVVAGCRIGRWALVAAGAVVARDVPDHALVAGNPARQLGWVGRTGHRLEADGPGWRCPATGDRFIEGDHGLRLDTGST
jgi:acetyltransferase-like isoleucine patch superfamily enzyme